MDRSKRGERGINGSLIDDASFSFIMQELADLQRACDCLNVHIQSNEINGHKDVAGPVILVIRS